VRPLRIVLLSTLLCAANSIYYGYVVYMRIIELLMAKTFTVFAAQIRVPLACQYYLFLTAIVLLIVFLLVSWMRVNEAASLDPKEQS
jgi:hypothetical protein